MQGRIRHAAALGIAALLLAGEALGQGPATPSSDAARARDAFERGSAAYRLGDYARAAAEYARADALDPNPAALRAALDAATLADDPVLGEELIERASQNPADAPGARTLDAARARFAHRTGRIAVRCSPGAACLATVDGAAFDTSRPKIVAAGPHTVVVQSDAAPETRIVNVAPDALLEVAARGPAPPAAVPAPVPTRPPERPAARARNGGGVPPLVFFSALGATAVAGGVTVWSALDTRSQHSTFDGECGPRATPGCSALSSEGQSAQTRTNVLFAVSGAFAVTTAILGVLVRWSGPHGESVALVPSGAGALVRVGF